MSEDDEYFGNPRWMRDIFNPPWMRQMKAMQDLVNPPWLREIRAMQDLVNPSWVRQMQATQEAIAPRLPLATALAANAALLTRSVLPDIGRDSIATALASITSSILGRSIESIARAFPTRSTLAAEALSALVGLKLQDRASQPQTIEDTPLVSSLASVQGAIETSQSQDDFAQKLTDAIEGIVQSLLALRETPGGMKLDASLVFNFLALVVSMVALHLADVQVHYAELSEQRTQRQERDAASTQRLSDERAAKLQEALDKLVRLQQEALASAEGEHDAATNRVWRFSVNRAVVVRERQDDRSKRLAILQAREIVEVDEYYRHWAHVRVVDHIRGGSHGGWVRKKYLSLCDE